MIHLKSVVTRVGKLLGVLAIMVFLFWLLPVIVAKNVGGAAERLSRFPGISPNGGLVSGVVTLVYPLAIVFAFAIAMTVATGGAGETSAVTNDAPDDNQSGGVDDDPTDTDLSVNETDVDDDDNESIESNHSDSRDIPDHYNESDLDYDPDEYNWLQHRIRIQVYDIEESRYSTLDDGYITLYDPWGPIDGQEVEEGYFHTFEALHPELEYTASVEVDGWPTVNATFKPKNYGGETLNITVGYDVEPADSHRSVFIEDFSELGSRFVQGGYAAYAASDDAVLMTTNAESDGVNPIDGYWTDMIYTDGTTGESYIRRGEGGDWNMDMDKDLHDHWPQKHRYVEHEFVIWDDPENVEREYLGRKTLNGTTLPEILPDEPLYDRIPQLAEADAALENRTVDVFYFDRRSASTTDFTVYVDVETKRVLRIEYANRQTEDYQPIWVTVEFWDHDNVDSVDEYVPDELQG